MKNCNCSFIFQTEESAEKRRQDGSKPMGVKSGVPDIFLPVPRGGFHGLWIEMKRVRSGRVTPAQKDWVERLNGQGYAAHICYGWEQASKLILDYLAR